MAWTWRSLVPLFEFIVHIAREKDVPEQTPAHPAAHILQLCLHMITSTYSSVLIDLTQRSSNGS